MEVIDFKTLAAQTDSATGDAVRLSESYSEAIFILNVTALATETADKLDVFLDVSPDGETWYNSIHFTQQDGDGSAAKLVAKVTKGGNLADADADLAVTADAAESVVRNLGILPYWRYRSTITDATTDNASFTYSVQGIFIE